MRRSMFYKTMSLGSGLVLMGLNTNCAKLNTPVNVMDLPQLEIQAPSLSQGGDGNFKYEGTFQMGQKTHSDLDMIWVLDNSGSMSQEIDHVRTNLEKFSASIGSQANLRMALISRAGNESTSYSPNSKDPSRFLQIDRFVNSTNALFLTASAFCKNGQGACSAFESEDRPTGPSIHGQLIRFLRPNSKKVFVIVSDDESEVAPDDFANAFQESYPNQDYTLFGFVGLGAASPCQYNTGSRYIEMAKNSNGQTYNICDTDWSDTFSTLAKSVLSLVAPAISLPHPIGQTEVINVILEGKLLDPSQYQITASGIVIKVELLAPSKTYGIQVNYRLKKTE